MHETLHSLEIPREPANVQAVVQKWPWRKPAPGWVKVSIDGDFQTSANMAGTGAVVRDDRGAFVEACSTPYMEINIPQVIEALALRDGVRFARQQGFHKVIVETDCQSALS